MTIVQSRNLPFNSIYADKFRRRIAAECEKFGIQFVFNNHLDETVPKEGFIETREGTKIEADLVV